MIRDPVLSEREFKAVHSIFVKINCREIQSTVGGKVTKLIECLVGIVNVCTSSAFFLFLFFPSPYRGQQSMYPNAYPKHVLYSTLTVLPLTIKVKSIRVRNNLE